MSETKTNTDNAKSGKIKPLTGYDLPDTEIHVHVFAMKINELIEKHNEGVK